MPEKLRGLYVRTYRTGLGVPYECIGSKYGAAPALTVREENVTALRRVVPPDFRSLWNNHTEGDRVQPFFNS